MSERSGGRERSEQSGASERVSSASERANGRASGPVFTSLFLFVPDHSASSAVCPVEAEVAPLIVETSPRVRPWTEAECYAFECGLRANGKDFNSIKRFRLPHRSVAEIVQFYYLWKKTERRSFVDL